MNIITPFSGLSLIVHIFVIGFANLHKFVIKKTNFRVEPTFRKAIRFPRFVNSLERLMSILIIITITGAISFSTVLALQTGIREGADEIHRIYVVKNVAKLPVIVSAIKQITITKVVYGDTDYYYKND